MSDELMQRYLRRLGFGSRPEPTWPVLTALVRAHLQTVPFENLDILAGRRAELSTAGALHKVVVQRRGGFCYELNEACGALLTYLGFSVSRIEARVWLQQQREFGPPYDHLALLVTLPEGVFLTDVGFGDNNRTPMRLPADELSDVSGHYTLAPVAEDLWLLARTERPLYQLTLAPQPLSAFQSMYRYHQGSPESIFAKGLICTRATDDGRITLSGDRLIVVQGSRRSETVVTDRNRLLEEHFGIVSEGMTC